MREVSISQGFVALIDDDDWGLVSAYCWQVHKPARSLTVYAKSNLKGRTIYMHRLILGEPDGLVVDHCDGNGLNNQRANLQAMTHRENLAAGVARRAYDAWKAERISAQLETDRKPPQRECR